MKKLILLLSIASLLTSSTCFASDANSLSTAYKHRTLFRGGYHDSKIAPDVFQITFKGNEFTSKQLAIKYALIRAAEVTKQSGATHFTILDKIDDSSPQSYHRSWPSFYRSSYLDSWVEYLAINALYSTKQPSFTLTIKTFSEKPSSEPYLIASDILASNADTLAQRKK